MRDKLKLAQREIESACMKVATLRVPDDVDLWSVITNKNEVITRSRLHDSHVNRVKRRVFQEVLKPRARVLDAGCGDGYHMAYIAQHFHELQPELYGLDISKESIKIAKQRLGFYPHVHLTTSPCEFIPYQDESFDVVLSFAVVQYTVEPLRAIAEMERVLRPGGYLLVYKGRGHHLDPIILPDVLISLIHLTKRNAVQERSSSERSTLEPRTQCEMETIWTTYLRGHSRLELIRRMPLMASFRWDFYARVFPALIPLLCRATHILNRLPFKYYKDSEMMVLRKVE